MQQSKTKQIYLASPLGFTLAGRMYNTDVLLPAVRAAGFDPLDPWNIEPEFQAVFDLAEGDPKRRKSLTRVNRRIGQRNARRRRYVRPTVLAVLDGNDVDSGTAAEIGYAAALKRPIVGLRDDLRVTGDNEATLVNLQVEWFITESGGVLSTDLADALSHLQAVVGGQR